ncbi:MAG: type II toxin-antitoxin system RelE/ParE family toxin [Elusimicrobia bacterium]|nr:type II toxin-antitoxin system RelE/ParE family toxin [Elusimicrobiota bacterium]
MEIAPLTIQYYQTANGRCPFLEWFEDQEERLQQIIDARLARVRHGLLGDSHSVGGAVCELRIDVGPGYRIYYGRDGKSLILLLQAGSKKGQAADIENARDYWADYLRRTRQ